MTTANEAAAGGSEQSRVDVATPKAGGEGPLSPRAAAHAVTHWRRQKAEAIEVTDPEAAVGESVPTPGDETAPTAPANPQPDEPISSELSPIEPPSSWEKEDKALFESLSRELQERVVQREQSRDSDVSRHRREATERAKALTAEQANLEQARQFYEKAVPAILQALQSQFASDFADIRTPADIEKMAKEDMPRYVRWDLQQKQANALQQSIGASLLRQAQEREASIARLRERENVLLAEKAPEYADEAQREQLRGTAVAVLNDLGFDDTELGQLWRGERDFSLHDHRLHLLIRDAVRWRDAQDKAKAAQAKPVPPVQRPGAAQAKGAAREAALKDLSRQLDNASGVKALRAAAKFVAERRKGQ